MTKKRRTPQSHRSSRKQRGRKGGFSSLAIPITVGLVVVAVIVGIIVSAEGQQRASGNNPAAVNTAQGLDTQSIPYPNVPRISLADTQKELENGQAILIDVRGQSPYDAGHAKGAISLPETEINAHLNELPRDKDLILYCT